MTPLELLDQVLSHEHLLSIAGRLGDSGLSKYAMIGTLTTAAAKPLRARLIRDRKRRRETSANGVGRRCHQAGPGVSLDGGAALDLAADLRFAEIRVAQLHLDRPKTLAKRPSVPLEHDPPEWL